MPVILSPNIKKTSERIDFDGNVVDPRTKQILVPKEVESVLPPSISSEAPVEAVKTSTTQTSPNAGAMSILDQIAEAKKNLENLEELKKLQIQQKKAELELLQQ